MVLNFKESTIQYKSNILHIVYPSTKYLSNPPLIDFNPLKYLCLDKLYKISCRNCSYLLLETPDQKKVKIFHKFNYNYGENIEMLSCHETHGCLEINTCEFLKFLNVEFNEVKIPKGNFQLDAEILKERFYCKGCSTEIV